MFRLLLLLALLAAAPAALATVPSLMVPPHRDSVSTESAPAPLLIPGRTNPADTTVHTRGRLALEQYALGRELERTHNPGSAIAAYRNAVRLDPAIGDAHYRMGHLYASVAQHRVAANEFAAELAGHPDRTDADRALGLALAQAGDTLAAIARLEALVARDSTDEPSWQALGFACAVAGRTATAERSLRRALALDPKDADAWRDLGVLLASTARDDDAAEAYRRAAALDPRDAGALVNLGNLERRHGRIRAALEAYRQAEARDSTHALALRGEVETLLELKRPKEAGEAYRRRVAHAPEDVGLRREAMRHFSDMGRRDEALDLAREGVRVSPRSPDAHLSLGMAFESVGDARAALAELRAAESLVRRPETLARIREMVARLRARAPDSLRGVFEADSARHAGSRAAARDTSGGRAR